MLDVISSTPSSFPGPEANPDPLADDVIPKFKCPVIPSLGSGLFSVSVGGAVDNWRNSVTELVSMLERSSLLGSGTPM